jgi:heterodisulfide reductase subunit C
MDVLPSQVMRLLQLGRPERVLRSQAIWQCVSCQTCSTRCPKSADPAGVIDYVRERALAEDSISPAQQPIVIFQKAFLNNVRRNGRVNELELTARFKTGVFLRTRQTGWLFKDAGLAPQLRKRDRIHFTSERAQDRALVERIFARCSRAAV